MRKRRIQNILNARMFSRVGEIINIDVHQRWTKVRSPAADTLILDLETLFRLFNNAYDRYGY